ncbi:hypothetical protein CYMTET_38895 [Cymbomonas tetramitiformis]|uniref:ATPase dynein-related AAA domain-containing protein n=1 Tax=Cymbomonas tetramitiformis TaxID=36881 RepID=A0AAE0CB54_9CHLO|nr:hypothetical protein CYMTET_38895 [Cymbomonas tetramitiformis]
MEVLWHDGKLSLLLKGSSASRESSAVGGAATACWVLLDELNLASPDVLECLAPLFARDRRPFVIPGSGEVVRDHDIRWFATTNPASTGGGRRNLPRALQSAMVMVRLGEYSEAETAQIAQHMFHELLARGHLREDHVQGILAVHHGLRRAIDDGEVSVRGGVVNLRDIRKLCAVLETCLQDLHVHFELYLRSEDGKGAPAGIGLIVYALRSFVDLVYGSRFDNPADTATLSALRDKCLPMKGASMQDLCGRVAVEKLPGLLRIGPVYLETGEEQDQEDELGEARTCVDKDQGQTGLCHGKLVHSPTTVKRLELMAAACRGRFGMLLEVPTCSGKTSLVKELARLAQRKLLIVPCNQELEASHLIGQLLQVSAADSIALATPEEAYRKWVEPAINSLLGDALPWLMQQHDGQCHPPLWSHQQLLQQLAEAVSAVSGVSSRSGGLEAPDMPDGRSPAAVIQCAVNVCKLLERVRRQLPEMAEEAEGGGLRTALSAHTQALDAFVGASRRKRAAEDEGDGDAGASAPHFEFVEGNFVQAVREGHWVLLDDINCALPEVIERLNPLLEDEPTLHLLEKGDGEELSRGRGIHPDFRIFATADPTRLQTGNHTLSSAFLNRVLRISLPALHLSRPPGIKKSTPPSSVDHAKADRENDSDMMQLLLAHFQDAPGGVEMAVVCSRFHAHVAGVAGRRPVTFRRLQSALRLQGCLQQQGASPARALVSALLSTYLQLLPDASKHVQVVGALRDLLVEHASTPREGGAEGDTLPRAPRVHAAGEEAWKLEAAVLHRLLSQLTGVLLQVGAVALAGLRRQSCGAQYQTELCGSQYFELLARRGQGKPAADDSTIRRRLEGAVGDSEGMRRLMQEWQLPTADLSTTALLSNLSRQCDELDVQLQKLLWSASFDDLRHRLQLLRHVEHELRGHLGLLWNPAFSAIADACSLQVAELCAEAGARVAGLLWCRHVDPALSMLHDPAIAELHRRVLGVVAGAGNRHCATRWILQMELRKPLVEAAETMPRLLRQLSTRAAALLWEGALRLPRHLPASRGSGQQAVIAGALTASTAHAMDVARCASCAVQTLQALMAQLNECMAVLRVDQSVLAARTEGGKAELQCEEKGGTTWFKVPSWAPWGRNEDIQHYKGEAECQPQDQQAENSETKCQPQDQQAENSEARRHTMMTVPQALSEEVEMTTAGPASHWEKVGRAVAEALHAARELEQSSDMRLLQQAVIQAEILGNEAAGNALLAWMQACAPSDGSPIDPPEVRVVAAADADFARELQNLSRPQLQHPLAKLWGGLLLSPALGSVARRISRFRFFSTASQRPPGALPTVLLPGSFELWALYDREPEVVKAHMRSTLALLLVEREETGLLVTVTAYVCAPDGEGTDRWHDAWCKSVQRECMVDRTDHIQMQYFERCLPADTRGCGISLPSGGRLGDRAADEAVVRACFSALVDYVQQKQQKRDRHQKRPMSVGASMRSCASSVSISPGVAWGPREAAEDATRVHAELLQAHGALRAPAEAAEHGALATLRVAEAVLQLAADATCNLERMSEMHERWEDIEDVCQAACLSATSGGHAAARAMSRLDAEVETALRALQPRSAAAAVEVHDRALQLRVGMPASAFLEIALRQADAVLVTSSAEGIRAHRDGLWASLRAIQLVTVLAVRQGLTWLTPEEVDASFATLREMHMALTRSLEVREHGAQHVVDVRLAEGAPDCSQLQHYRAEMGRVLEHVMPVECDARLHDMTVRIRAAFDAALRGMEALLNQGALRAPCDDRASKPLKPAAVNTVPAPVVDEEGLRMGAWRRQLEAMESRLRALLEECRSLQPLPHPVINAVRELLVAVRRPLDLLAGEDPAGVNELAVRQAQLREARVRQALREYKQHTQDPDLLRTLLREKSPECEQAALLTVEVPECMWAHPVDRESACGADGRPGGRVMPEDPPGMHDIRQRVRALEVAAKPAGAPDQGGGPPHASARLCAELLCDSVAMGTWKALLACLERIALMESVPAESQSGAGPGRAARVWGHAQELCAVLSDDLAGALLVAEPARGTGGNGIVEQARRVLPAVLEEYALARSALLAKSPERVGDHSLAAQVCRAACIGPDKPPSALSLCAAVEGVGAWQHTLRARLQGALKGVPCAVEPPLLTPADVLLLTFPATRGLIWQLQDMDEAALHAAGPAPGSAEAPADLHSGGLWAFTLDVNGRSRPVLDCQSAVAAAQGTLQRLGTRTDGPALLGLCGLKADTWPQHQAATALCLLRVLDCACRELPASVDRVLGSRMRLGGGTEQHHACQVRKIDLEIDRWTQRQSRGHFDMDLNHVRAKLDELRRERETAMRVKEERVCADLRQSVSRAAEMAAQLKLVSIADPDICHRQRGLWTRSPDSLGQDLHEALTNSLIHGTHVRAARTPEVWLRRVRDLEDALRKLDPKHDFVRALSRVCQLARIGLHAFHNSMQAVLHPALGQAVQTVLAGGIPLSEAVVSLGEAAGPLGDHLESMIAASLASSPAHAVLTAADRVVELLEGLAEKRHQLTRAGLGDAGAVLQASLQRLECFGARCVLTAGRHTALQQGAAGLFEAHEERLLPQLAAIPPLCNDEAELHQLLKAFRLLSGMMAHSLRELPELLLRGYNGNPAHLLNQIDADLEGFSSHFLPCSYLLRLLVGGLSALVESVPIGRGASATWGSDTAHAFVPTHRRPSSSAAPLMGPSTDERRAMMCTVGALETFAQCPAVEISAVNRAECAGAVDNLRACVEALAAQLRAHRGSTRNSGELGRTVGHRLRTLAQLVAKHFLDALCGITIATATPNSVNDVVERGTALAMDMEVCPGAEPHDRDVSPRPQKADALRVRDALVRPHAVKRLLAEALRTSLSTEASITAADEGAASATLGELGLAVRLLLTGMRDVSSVASWLYAVCPGEEVISVSDGLQLCQAYVEEVEAVLSTQIADEKMMTATLRGALDRLCGSEGTALDIARRKVQATFEAALTEGCNEADRGKAVMQAPLAPTRERWKAHCTNLCEARARMRVWRIRSLITNTRKRVQEMKRSRERRMAEYARDHERYTASIKDAEAALESFLCSAWQHGTAQEGSPEQCIFDPMYVRCMLDLAAMTPSIDQRLPSSLRIRVKERFSCCTSPIPQFSADQKSQAYYLEVLSKLGMDAVCDDGGYLIATENCCQQDDFPSINDRVTQRKSEFPRPARMLCIVSNPASFAIRMGPSSRDAASFEAKFAVSLDCLLVAHHGK